MPSKPTTKTNAPKPSGSGNKSIDLQIHCKKCGKDPYDCKCGQGKKGMTNLQYALKMWKKFDKKKMSEEQKRRLLVGLRKLKEGYAGGGNTDITNADNLVAEMDTDTERNVVAKTFGASGDFNTYVNRHRGIQMTPKEQQAILGFQKAKPNQHDQFFTKYESTDQFGTNQTVVIKKLKDGNQFCWTAFASYSKADDEDEPEEPTQPGGKAPAEEDNIRITKTISFSNDDEGSNILGDLLRGLEL